MKIYREVNCSTAQKRWLLHHVHQLLYIYDELVEDMRKRYVQIIHEKGYIRSNREDRGRYLENRRIRKGRYHSHLATTFGMVSSPL